eukprot:CAMPEP_0172460438 /NCGR_PEP_ID=MMETSP1065-20121228/36919_1 /TAXON_ID=265537 /ORGANISM="Amphiprora paludosa, Strain CCMP125" /LENGTH=65 /DNA_ID=CAMNT_0013215459 /DNA_START=21 /DNA_END=214 /DNA_ORIENTATION=-
MEEETKVSTEEKVDQEPKKRRSVETNDNPKRPKHDKVDDEETDFLYDDLDHVEPAPAVNTSQCRS